ncbi:hypothetical protein ABIE69_002007 [Rhodobacteraceae bacterium MBR-64]|jgi:hypothetical protein
MNDFATMPRGHRRPPRAERYQFFGQAKAGLPVQGNKRRFAPKCLEKLNGSGW